MTEKGLLGCAAPGKLGAKIRHQLRWARSHHHRLSPGWAPTPYLQRFLVDSLANAEWLLHRASRLEAELWSHHIEDDRTSSFHKLNKDAPIGDVYSRTTSGSPGSSAASIPPSARTIARSLSCSTSFATRKTPPRRPSAPRRKSRHPAPRSRPRTRRSPTPVPRLLLPRFPNWLRSAACPYLGTKRRSTRGWRFRPRARPAFSRISPSAQPQGSFRSTRQPANMESARLAAG